MLKNVMKDLLQSNFVRNIFKSFTIYTGAGFISQAVPFFLLPVLTRFLLPEDYGILATFIAMMGIVDVIISMGSTDAVIRGYFDKNKKGFDFPVYVFNAICLKFSAFLVLIGVIFLGSSFMSQKMHVPPFWLYMLPLIGICTSIYAIPFKLFIFRQKPLPYAIMQIANALLEIMLAVFFIVVLSLNWQGRPLGILISKVIFAVIAIFILLKGKWLKFSINYGYLKNILRYGGPVVFHSLGFVVITATDRFFLNRMIGLSATGIYSVGYAISGILAFFIGAFNMAWSPILYERLGSITDSVKRKLVRFTYFYFMIIILGALVLIGIVPVTLRFFIGKNFQGAFQFVFWITLGYAVHGMYTMLVNYIFYQKKTYLLSLIAIITVVLNMALNYTFIKLNGAIGAAQAAFITFLARFLLVWYFSNKVYPMPWFDFFKRNKDGIVLKAHF